MGKKIITSTIAAVGFVLIFVFAYLATHSEVAAPTTEQEPKRQAQTENSILLKNNEAFKNALNLYIQKKQEGLDMEDGPCLGIVAEDWVLDIAHDPRLPVDDKAGNQCEDFTSGKAKHFIEFDPNGELIRSQ